MDLTEQRQDLHVNTQSLVSIDRSALELLKVESLRVQVAQKDMFISELLDRIAIVECEVRQILDRVFSFCCGVLIYCMATHDCLGC